MPGGMSWGEAWRLTWVLANDPSSHVAAALAGWEFPASREYLVTASLYDAFVSANARPGRRVQPYPRPWPDKDKQKLGKATIPQSEIRAALAARGHGAPAPQRGTAERRRDARGRFVRA